MDGSGANGREPRVGLRLEPDVLDHRRHSPPREMASPPIPDELLLDIFRRIPDLADLVRASAACVSFRRIIADRSFLRQYRKLHAPPLLGFFDARKVFQPVQQPHPSASAARAVALAADFSFSFLPVPARHWLVRDIRDGRVLLDRVAQHEIENGYGVAFREMVVCDPLHRRYLLLPPIPDDLAASVEDPFLVASNSHWQTFLAPAETSAAEETSFSVIWMAKCTTKLVAFVFSSSTGKWRGISSQSWTNLLPGLLSCTVMRLLKSRHCVYGCFYWVIYYNAKYKLLVLDTETMEFSIADFPGEANGCRGFAMLEAGEGRPGMFVLADDSYELSYFIEQNDGESSNHWQKVKTISLDAGTVMMCTMKKYLLLYQQQSSLPEPGCFMLDIETFQFNKVCAMRHNGYKLHAYSNFPPSLLSSPTISSGVENRAEKEMLEQGCAASSSAQ